jgi:4-hydroxythreonine-4-phosphate dehydrogenase
MVRIGLTLGDPAGIGTEIALAALRDPETREASEIILFGSPGVVRREIERQGLPLRVVEITLEDEFNLDGDEIGVVPSSYDEALVPYGEISAEGGHAAVRAVLAAIAAAKLGLIDAICTAPLNKESMRIAGYQFDGHTELLAEHTGVRDVSMLLMGRQLRVAHVTTHTAIGKVSEKITAERLTKVIDIAHSTMLEYGFESPRVAVAGLNPHAGEHGLFGDEEDIVMRPVIERFQARGLSVVGPISPDAVFIDALAGRYDIVIAAYHDQGHIPVKLVEREHAVNVTGGLPIIRTSVDHGTAFDIAGLGVADDRNMRAALAMATRLAKGRTQQANGTNGE